MRILMKKTFITVYVIADSKERENMIREQIKAIEAEQRCSSQIEEGSFERSFETWSDTQLPSWEVLILNIWTFQKKAFW